MKEFKTQKFKIRLRTAPVKLKAALVALIVLSMGALLALRWVHNGILAETQLKREQATAMEGANAGVWAGGKPKKWYYAIPVVIFWLLLLFVIYKSFFSR